MAHLPYGIPMVNLILTENTCCFIWYVSEFSRPNRRQILPPEFDEKLGSRKHHHSPFLDEKHRDPHSQETGGLKYNVKRHIENYRKV